MGALYTKGSKTLRGALYTKGA